MIMICHWLNLWRHFYFQRGSRDFDNFDSMFIAEKPTLSPTPQSVLDTIPQDEFAGFSFVNVGYKPER